MVDFRCQQSEDRATQGCDLSASWLLRGGAIRYRSFLLHADRRDTGGEPLRNKAINLGVQGAEPLGTPPAGGLPGSGYFPVVA